MHFQLHIFRLQYSIERICAAIRDNRTLRCPLYCKFGAKYSAHHPVYPMWSVVPDIYNVTTARIFRLQYSAVGNCAVIVDITTNQCALYSKLGAKYSANPAVYTMCTVVRTYTKYLQLLIVRPQYSTESDCAATRDMPPFGCPLYCKFGANTAHTLQFTLCELWSRTYTM
jgi:hypothetical protein